MKSLLKKTNSFGPLSQKGFGWFLIFLLLSNGLTYSFFKRNGRKASKEIKEEKLKPLYLLDQASPYLMDKEKFEVEVRALAKSINVPAEWIMAIIFSESKFDASIVNLQGTGATGLFQWNKTTIEKLGTNSNQLRNLNHSQQLKLAKTYFSKLKKHYGPFNTLTELYLAHFYPKALNEPPCFTIFAKPSKDYSKNIILDENKDSQITKYDIEKRMQRLFPTADAIQPTKAWSIWN